MVAFIIKCKAFGLPTNLEVFRKIFDIEPLKGPGWYTFQKKSGMDKFIRKLPLSIDGWKSGFFYMTNGQDFLDIP